MKRIANQREKTMNAKRAKFLRKVAREAGDRTISGHVTKEFKIRLVNTDRLNPDGTPEQRAYIPRTTYNKPGSVRATYRTFKKLEK